MTPITDAAEVLFTLMAERYERRSLIITSNLVFSQWDRISSIEKGLVRPNIQTLQTLAEGLSVLLPDLVCFPARSERERAIDHTRHLSRAQLRRFGKA